MLACLNIKKSFFLINIPLFWIVAILFLNCQFSSLNAQVKANFTVTGGDSCSSRSVTLTASSNPDITNYSWEIKNKFTGQSLDNGTGAIKTRNFTSPGVYQAILTVSGGGQSDKLTKEIKVYYLPSVDFTADATEGCPPLTVNFTNNSKPGDGFIIKSEWVFNDGNKDARFTDETVTNIYNVSGLYSPTLIVTNNFGCKRSLTKDKYINIYNQIKPSYTVSNNSNCSVPSNVTFNNTTGDKNFNYTWDFGDGTTLLENASTFTHQYSKAGRFKIQITAKNNTGACTGFTESEAKNKLFIGKPTADFDLPSQICAFEKLSFVPKPDPSGLADTGRWYFEDDNAFIDTINTKHTFKKPGNWKVKFISFNKTSQCKSDTVVKTVAVLASPKAGIKVDNKGGCVAPLVINAQNSTINGSSFKWDFGDGSAFISKNDLSSVSHTYNSLGEYYLTLTAKGSNGCENVDTVKIDIQVPKILIKATSQNGCIPFAIGIKSTASSGDSITSFNYDLGDGVTRVSSPKDSIGAVYSTSGNFFLKVTAATKQGCTAQSDSLKIFVDQFCEVDGDSIIKNKNGNNGAIEVTKVPDCSQKYTFVFRDTTLNATIISWTMDGVVLSNTSNPISYTFPNPTTKKKFVVSVKLKDGFGNSLDHGVRVVVINEKANFEADLMEFCKNTLVKFKTIAIDSTQINKYYWDYGDYSYKDTIYNDRYKDTTGFFRNGNTSHLYRWRGNFRPMLTIVDKFGCRDSLKQKAIIKVKAPDAQFSIDKGRFCNVTDFNVSFTDLNKTLKTPGTTITEWKWSFGDNTTEVYNTNSDVPHNYKNTKSYQNFQIRLTIKDSDGCEDTKDSNVTSYVPKVSFSTTDTLRCNKFKIEFKNTSLARVIDTNQYTWKYGNGNTSKGFKGRMIYADTGKYDVTLIVKDNGGCIDSAFKPAYVKLVKPKALFKIGSDTAKCLGTFSVPFTSLSTYSNSYKWDFDDGEITQTDQKTVFHFYKKSQQYNIKLSVKGLDGCTDSITKKLDIKGSNENLELKDTVICSGEGITAIVRGNNINKYNWDFGDFTATNDLTTKDSVVHVYSKAGLYYPNVIVSTPEGCEATVKSKYPIIVDSIYVDKISNIDCGKDFAPLKGYSFLKADSLYEWAGPAGAIYKPGKDSLKCAANTVGTYTLQAKKGSCAMKESVNMTTSGIEPEVDAGIDKKQDCLTETTSLIGSSTTSNIKFKWSGPPGTTFYPNDSVSNPEVNTLGAFILKITQKTCSKSDTMSVSPCTLYRNDTIVGLCATNTGTPAIYNSFMLSKLNPAVSDTSASNSSWYSDKNLSNIISNPDNYDVATGDSLYAKIVSKDNSETGKALVIFTVAKLKASILANGDTICENNSPIILNAFDNKIKGITYEWLQNGKVLKQSSSPEKLVLNTPQATGKYDLKVNNSTSTCIPDQSSWNVKIYDKPDLFLIPEMEVEYIEGNETEIPLSINPIYDPNDSLTIKWDKTENLFYYIGFPAERKNLTSDVSVQNPVYVPKQQDFSTTYNVKVTSGPKKFNCYTSRTIKVYNFIPANIPNAFSPNGDGLNDTWVIKGLIKYPNTKITVFNRWGNMVYENKLGHNEPWDGKMHGSTLTAGTYYYIIEFNGSQDNSDHKKDGSVTLVY